MIVKRNEQRIQRFVYGNYEKIMRLDKLKKIVEKQRNKE